MATSEYPLAGQIPRGASSEWHAAPAARVQARRQCVLTVDLTNPGMYFEKRLILQKDTVHIIRTIFLWRGTAYQRLGIQNHGDRLVQIHLSLSFGNDFADVFEVRGMRRLRRGTSQVKVDAAKKQCWTMPG
jgi:glycogen debranching enzyme